MSYHNPAQHLHLINLIPDKTLLDTVTRLESQLTQDHNHKCTPASVAQAMGRQQRNFLPEICELCPGLLNWLFQIA